MTTLKFAQASDRYNLWHGIASRHSRHLSTYSILFQKEPRTSVFSIKATQPVENTALTPRTPFRLFRMYPSKVDTNVIYAIEIPVELCSAIRATEYLPSLQWIWRSCPCTLSWFDRGCSRTLCKR